MRIIIGDQVFFYSLQILVHYKTTPKDPLSWTSHSSYPLWNGFYYFFLWHLLNIYLTCHSLVTDLKGHSTLISSQSTTKERLRNTSGSKTGKAIEGKPFCRFFQTGSETRVALNSLHGEWPRAPCPKDVTSQVCWSNKRVRPAPQNRKGSLLFPIKSLTLLETITLGQFHRWAEISLLLLGWLYLTYYYQDNKTQYHPQRQ